MSRLDELNAALADPGPHMLIALTAMKRYQDITGRGDTRDNALGASDLDSMLWQRVVMAVQAEAQSRQLTLDLEGVRDKRWTVGTQ